MATTGEVYSTGTGTTAAESPWDDVDFSGLTNHQSDNGIYVGATFASTGEKTYVCYVKGFDLSVIPSNAVVDGVTVRVEADTLSGTAEIGLLQLLDVSGSRVGDNKCATPQGVTTTDTVYTFGGASDSWGNSLTAAWVKDSDFGVAIAYTNTSAGANAGRFDYITVEVEYHVPPQTYWIVAPNSGWSDPTAAEIKAGQKSGGAAATSSGSSAAPSTDQTDYSIGTASSLAAATAYKAAAYWDNEIGGTSAVVVSAAFTTGGAAPAVRGFPRAILNF
jgi:hypothetical protein